MIAMISFMVAKPFSNVAKQVAGHPPGGNAHGGLKGLCANAYQKGVKRNGRRVKEVSARSNRFAAKVMSPHKRRVKSVRRHIKKSSSRQRRRRNLAIRQRLQRDRPSTRRQRFWIR
jgi:hypothetical protein